MSTALGIAAVTHVLKDLLNDGLINSNVAADVGTVVGVTSLPPGQLEGGTGSTATQLNVFMYRVTPNTGWINTGYPSRNGRGAQLNNPPLALDLHYLLTAFGESELHAEILLGYAMQILHENPVLSRGAIRNSLGSATVSDTNSTLSGVDLALATSQLAEQIEQLKITNENINMEEMSRLWTAFQTKYRPCTAYQATVVLIESQTSTSAPLPVQERVFYTVPFKQPFIEHIRSQIGANAPKRANQRITTAHRMVIRGKQLKKEDVRVVIGGTAFTPDPDNSTDNEVVLEVPDTLKAGIQGVQIVHPIQMGSPAEPRPGAESNLVSFVLSPVISGQEIFNRNAADGIMISAEVQLNVTPVVYSDQRVILLLNEINPEQETPPASYSFLLPASFWTTQSSPATTITFPIANVKKGDYLLRIQADGAESPLITGAQGAYTDPHLLIQ